LNQRTIQETLTIELVCCEVCSCANVHSGLEILKIQYEEKSDYKGWAGIYFQYSDKNWGDQPCRNLKGGKKISFWAKSDDPIEVNFYSGYGNPNLGDLPRKHIDSYDIMAIRNADLDHNWQEFTFDTPDLSMESVCAPLAVVFNARKGSGMIYLDDAMIELSRLDQPRLLQSFTPNACLFEDIGKKRECQDTKKGKPKFGLATNAAHVYDQALVLLALLARGNTEDLHRGELIAQALIDAQNNDRTPTFKDGRLRNAYASGQLIDQGCKFTRMPGAWNPNSNPKLSPEVNTQGKTDACPKSEQYQEDEFTLGSDTGNMAWVGIALIQAHHRLPAKPGSPYLSSVQQIADWIVKNNKVNDDLGGFQGGLEPCKIFVDKPSDDCQDPSTWRSTEHNIDIAVLFGHLEQADKAKSGFWHAQKQHAIKFLKHMLHQQNGELYVQVGTEPDLAVINHGIIALDTQTWMVLSDLGILNNKQQHQVLDWAIQNCDYKDTNRSFDFNCDNAYERRPEEAMRDGSWWEGTGQMALALLHLKRKDQAQAVLKELVNAQLTEGEAKGSLPAASICGLTTGIDKKWRYEADKTPWLYPATPHIGATSWFIFAMLNKNPYHLID
jgi:hypothetical protein